MKPLTTSGHKYKSSQKPNYKDNATLKSSYCKVKIQSSLDISHNIYCHSNSSETAYILYCYVHFQERLCVSKHGWLLSHKIKINFTKTLLVLFVGINVS